MIDSLPGKGLVFAIVGPSAVGKNTIMGHALEQVEQLRQLPTATTRRPRPDEREGREHEFHSDVSFDDLIEQNALLEWQWVHGHRYGIPRRTVEHAISTGNDLVADIEVFGASILKEKYPDNVVLVFVAPPSMEVLEKRIRARKTDTEETEEQIAARMRRAIFEMKYAAKSDYLIINDVLEQAVAQFLCIASAERRRRDLHSTRVTVIFRRGASALTQNSNSETLPSITVLPGELADQAVQRVADALGLPEFEFIRRPGIPGEGIAPLDARVELHGGNPVLVQTFECLVPETAPAPDGWEWSISDIA